MRRTLQLTAGLALALALAAPAVAQTQDRFTFDDEFVDTYTCGATLTTSVHGDGMARLAADGSWIATTVRLRYAGVAFDPATASTVHLTNRQILREEPGEATLIGQGSFIRLAGAGVVLMDVGRLVFSPADGSTLFASAQVLPFDDPATRDQLDDAVCSLFD